jgi:hypothetical protein
VLGWLEWLKWLEWRRSQQSPGRCLKFVGGQATGAAAKHMLGEVPGLGGIQGIKHPPRGIPEEAIGAVVMAGIEALPGHRILLEDSPGFCTSKLLRRQHGKRFNVSGVFCRAVRVATTT